MEKEEEEWRGRKRRKKKKNEKVKSLMSFILAMNFPQTSVSRLNFPFIDALEFGEDI